LAALLAVLLLVAALSAACGGDDEGGNSGPVKVTTTLALFADMVKQVGGDRVDVSALVPGSADIHTYELPPSNITKVGQARLIVMNGLDLEAGMEKTIRANASSSATILELAAGLPTVQDEEGDNPHLWLDVKNGMTYVEHIRDTLISLDPSGADVYRANTDRYLGELRALDQEVVTAIDSIPPENRKIVGYHDAFPYLADRYGLEVVAFVVASPGKEPSAKDVADLTQAIRDEKVPAVFQEPEYSGSILTEAANDAGVQVCTLDAHAFTDEVQSYVELMRFNVQELTRCLGESSG
jgi:ABC-type Zn uptake system ZnuABC Zn-binding protein ZnuA